MSGTLMKVQRLNLLATLFLLGNSAQNLEADIAANDLLAERCWFDMQCADLMW